MGEEKKIVSWALIVLFLSLTIVYSLVYMRKKEVFLTNEKRAQQEQGASDKKEENEKIEENQEEKTEQLPTVVTPPIIDLSTEQEQPPLNPHQVNTGNTQIPETGNSTLETALASTESLHLLSGTTQFFGVLDIIDVLGIQPDYTLQDTRGNYFAYYGEKTLDFGRTVQQLGGNIYTMATESEILENQLFGDKVSFINMLAFKDKFVLMVIEIEGETRLFQLPADKYHHEKSYLKSLFIL